MPPKLAIDNITRPGHAATIARVEPGGECLALRATDWSSNRIFKSYEDAAKPGTTSHVPRHALVAWVLINDRGIIPPSGMP